MKRIQMKCLANIISLLIMLLMTSNEMYGQHDKDIQISNLPYYNFGKGLGLTSSDSLFQFNIRFRIQNRATIIKNEDQDIAIDGQIRRLRLRFDGYVGKPNLIYLLQLSFAPGDVGEIEAGSNLNVIRDAVVFYKLDKNFNFGFGQTKLPGNRQRVNSSGALQLSDRSINNARFNIDRDFGLFINHINEYENAFSWNVKTSITTGDGRNYTDSPDNGLAYTGKLEIMPLGRFKKDGIYYEGDLAREDKIKLMFSGAYHYNHKAKRQGGVLGDLLYGRRNLSSVLLDGLMKYQGFALIATYMNRHTDNPITDNGEGNQVIIYKGKGYDLQSSYIFKSHWEIIGRYSNLLPHDNVASHFPKQRQFTIGLTKYIWEHAFKVQMEASMDKLNYFDASQKTNTYIRFQVEMGI